MNGDVDDGRGDIGEDAETGKPIAALSQIEIAHSPGFVARLRRRLDRRDLTSNGVTLFWYSVSTVLVSFLDMILSTVGQDDNREGGNR